MRATAGAKLGPYEILSPIGAGGMGEVYKARDTRLDRIVAIKILPEHLASDLKLRERFEQEARAVSSLNHPHICTLHDIGNQDGIAYLVMEYLEGETLEARLTKGPLPLDRALAIAIQIAGALDAAHRKGVVHRDLKPGNVMLAGSGAKLLDFGLARVIKRAAAAVADETVTMGITNPGTILGTFQYMAPEQLEAKEADARTDIFAFGAVLYEMLTGRKAFAGKSRASLIAAIMNSEPTPLSVLQPGPRGGAPPPALDHVVKKCLAKEPDARWQTACDLKDELQWIAGSGPEAVSAPAGSARTARLRVWQAAALVSFALAVALAAWGLAGGWFRANTLAAGTARFLLALPEGIPLPMSGNAPAGPQAVPSPDGRRIAFLTEKQGTTHLWVRSLDSLAAQQLDKTDGANFPFWSPDGQFIGFFADNSLKRISVSGGSLRTIYAVPAGATGGGDGAAWNRDGSIVFASGTSGLMQVPAAGGLATPVTTLDKSRGEIGHSWPQFLPDGKHFLYFARSQDPDQSGIYVQALGSQERRLVLKSSARRTPLPGICYSSAMEHCWRRSSIRRAFS
jgi:eukaryotic-like serine/threonine-protein kinase